jgi:hypothetical protein
VLEWHGDGFINLGLYFYQIGKNCVPPSEYGIGIFGISGLFGLLSFA